jgi:hypothetical protein
MYGFHFGITLLAPRNLFLREDYLVKLIGVGRKIEQFEIANYSPLCAETERMEFTHENALLTSILNQEKHANELLGALGQGKGALDQLIKKVVLEHVGATRPWRGQPSRRPVFANSRTVGTSRGDVRTPQRGVPTSAVIFCLPARGIPGNLGLSCLRPGGPNCFSSLLV